LGILVADTDGKLYDFIFQLIGRYYPMHDAQAPCLICSNCLAR
jgi:hypothetical protein